MLMFVPKVGENKAALFVLWLTFILVIITSFFVLFCFLIYYRNFSRLSILSNKRVKMEPRME